MRVLVASHLYPSALSHTAGSFVHNQARFVAEHASLAVTAPVPWFPLPGCGRWSTHRRLPRREVRDGIDVTRPRYLTFPRRLLPGVAWRSYRRALAPAVKSRPDLIHAHCAYPDGVAAVSWGRRLNIPVAITVHGHDIKDLAEIDDRWRRLIAGALSAATAVIAVSAELEERVLALGVAAAQVKRVPNGVDCQLFARPVERESGAGGWRLIYVGRFDRAKGLEDLLRAMVHVRRLRPDVSLTLVGGNPHTGTADPFQRLADELGLSSCVEFLSEVPWEEIPGHLARADLFVLPSHSEGLPLALLEATAAGLPVVATRCGGPVEVVDDEVGRLVDVGDIDGLAVAIEGVLADYGNCDREAIRQRAVSRYDYRGVAQRLCEVYAEAVAAGGGRPT